jgi:Fe-S cluster assembly iron-binding protein IscA
VFKSRAPIILTAGAAARIGELVGGKENVLGIRLGVRRRGCNGMR